MGTVAFSGGYSPENALDALLDELQTFAKPTIAEVRSPGNAAFQLFNM